MKPIDEQHIAEPGLVVLDITGGDEDTVRAVMATLEERWATSGIGPVRSDPGEPGVRARIYATSCARDSTAHEVTRLTQRAGAHREGGQAQTPPTSPTPKRGTRGDIPPPLTRPPKRSRGPTTPTRAVRP
ncbi:MULTISPECIES: DUF6207 family protein [unclassified Streptomyces]|uniref:DUF6207 family protein n=1 Tax=unclassified Streptomyces TaxID=2593676 RepID=UPI00333217C6